MAYATLQEIIRRGSAQEVINLLNDRVTGVTASQLEAYAEGDASPTDELEEINEIVTEAIASAEGVADSYLRGRYSLPLSVVTKPLRRAVVDIARFELFGSRATRIVEKRYDDAIDWLKSVSRGQADIGINADDEAPDQTSDTIKVASSVDPPSRVFTTSQRESSFVDGY